MNNKKERVKIGWSIKRRVDRIINKPKSSRIKTQCQ